jgi:hypothetical protein
MGFLVDWARFTPSSLDPRQSGLMKRKIALKEKKIENKLRIL